MWPRFKEGGERAEDGPVSANRQGDPNTASKPGADNPFSAFSRDVWDADFEIVADDGLEHARHERRPFGTGRRAVPRDADVTDIGQGRASEFFRSRKAFRRKVRAGNAPNRFAFYGVSAVLVVFTFLWSGGYVLFMPRAERDVIAQAPAKTTASAPTIASIVAEPVPGVDPIITGGVPRDRSATDTEVRGSGSFLILGAAPASGKSVTQPVGEGR